MGEASAIQLVGLTKRFGDVVAVDGVDLTIGDGEFFSLLGPSGSGKTTVLRLIAGFEEPTSGAVLLGGQDVTHSAPHARDLNTVFQDYALFPHMDVRRNVEYGLKVKGVGRSERRQRAMEMLESVQLAHLAERRPEQLSGGQRQRVALARALVNRPKVLLLDEPLGALDLKLREEMQTELKAIQRDVGITFVFVTHDQGEALSMSDRVAVFNHGRIEQADTPQAIYEHPATTFVASFVGTSNLLDPRRAGSLLGERAWFSVRPERIRLDGAPPSDTDVAVDARVTDVQYHGADCRVRLATRDGERLHATVPSGTASNLALGGDVTAVFPRAAAFRVDDTGDAVADAESAPPEPSADDEHSRNDVAPSILTTTATAKGATE